MSKQLPIKDNLYPQPNSKLSHSEDPLMLVDSWHGEKDLGMRVNKYMGGTTLYFGDIPPCFRDTVKRFILYSRGQGKAFGTLSNYTRTLRDFSCFLEAQYIYFFEDITDETFSAYSISIQHLSQRAWGDRLSRLKVFFDIGSTNGWFDISTYWFKGTNIGIRPNHERIKYIPNEVLHQLDEHLHLLPEPLQRMVILIRTLGLRGGELLQMRFDCLRQRRNGEWELHFTNWKFNEKSDVMPIISEIAEVVKEQQIYIKAHLGEEFEYLFCANTPSVTNSFTPQPRVMYLQSFNGYLNKLAERCNICDKSGKQWRFTSHQFRRTVATKMTNEGVRQYIIQRYLRHETPGMMQHYAHILPETITKEIEQLHKRKKIVDVTGKEVSINRSELENDTGLQWLRNKMQPKSLAMGFCARPELLKPCPHANACMNCQHFRLDEDDLPALRQHLEKNRELKTESQQLGYVRQLRGIEDDELILIKLIENLEDNHG